MRIRAPKTTALIFSSGKMVCTGAKTEALAREAARQVRQGRQQARLPRTVWFVRPSSISVDRGVTFEVRAHSSVSQVVSDPSRVFLRPDLSAGVKIQNMVACDAGVPHPPRGSRVVPWSLRAVRARALPRSDLSHAAAQDRAAYLRSGKIVLTGGKKREDIYQAFENIHPVPTEFRSFPTRARRTPAQPAAAQQQGNHRGGVARALSD